MRIRYTDSTEEFSGLSYDETNNIFTINGDCSSTFEMCIRDSQKPCVGQFHAAPPVRPVCVTFRDRYSISIIQ